jgi:lipopolysaccharide biosynthesis glycosyltransferase
VKPLTVVGGCDPREAIGAAVCQFSITRRASRPVSFIPLAENALRSSGLYRRSHYRSEGQLFDAISAAPMTTDFAISRFLTRHLVGTGWALFCDFADMLFLADAAELFDLADDRFAVMVVKHKHYPTEAEKMDGQSQTAYPRKNWSSLMLVNCDHPANEALTLDAINELPGRDLHAFCWLPDDLIAELPAEWNHLVGVQPENPEAKVLHYTLGIPSMPGYARCHRSNDWWQERAAMEGAR